MQSMLVYGIRCSPLDLNMGLPDSAHADYYMDYGILAFPAYTRPTCLNSHGYLTPRFWQQVGAILGSQICMREIDEEHPYVSEGEDAVIQALRERYPSLRPAWYHVPRVHTPPSLEVSEMD
jgi:hypothetical protein